MPSLDLRRGIVPALATAATLLSVSCGEGGGPAEPVTQPNRTPSATTALADLTISPGETATLDASGSFTDPDEDPLTYAAASSDVAVAMVAVTGSTVTVTGVARGTATVTVTARDPGGLEATQNLVVTVDSMTSPVTVTLAADHAAGREGGQALLGVLIDPAPPSAINVAYSLGSDDDPATADADTADYGAGKNMLEIAAGQTGIWLEIPIDDDTNIESTREIFTLTLDAPATGAGYVLGSETSATVTIEEGVCDRTPKVGYGIVQQARVDDCTDVDDSHLAAIRGLDLGRLAPGGPMDTLKGRDFVGLFALVRLDLNGNRLAGLPPDVFSELSRLTYLGLWNNELTSLPEDVFSGLTALDTLQLSANNLVQLPPRVFKDLSSLRSLGLASNELAELPASVFSDLSDLVSLSLHGNSLATLPAGLFAGLARLEILDLAHNQLETLPAGAFAGLERLVRLSLEVNRLVELPADGFAGLSNLKRLSFLRNQLHRLPVGVFSDLSSLESLDFAYNDLVELPEGALSGLFSLEDLDFSWNELAELPAGVFSDLTSLRSLNIIANDVARLPAEVLSPLSSLEYLTAWGNDFTELPAGVFSGLSNLVSLSLSSGKLATLPANVFAGLSRLESLYLGGNELTQLPVGLLSALTRLERLELGNNKLDELPAGVFSGLSQLKSLELSGNPGAPFALTLEPRRTDSDDLLAPSPATVAVVVAEGTPFAMDVHLAIVGGGLSQDTAKIATGDEASSEVTVTRSEGRQAATRIDVGRLPLVPEEITGITLKAGDSLLLFASGATGVTADASDRVRSSASEDAPPEPDDLPF